QWIRSLTPGIFRSLTPGILGIKERDYPVVYATLLRLPRFGATKAAQRLWLPLEAGAYHEADQIKILSGKKGQDLSQRASSPLLFPALLWSPPLDPRRSQSLQGSRRWGGGRLGNWK